MWFSFVYHTLLRPTTRHSLIYFWWVAGQTITRCYSSVVFEVRMVLGFGLLRALTHLVLLTPYINSPLVQIALFDAVSLVHGSAVFNFASFGFTLVSLWFCHFFYFNPKSLLCHKWLRSFLCFDPKDAQKQNGQFKFLVRKHIMWNSPTRSRLSFIYYTFSAISFEFQMFQLLICKLNSV